MSALEIELSALVEKLDSRDLPGVAALLLTAWCHDRGASEDSVQVFFAAMLEIQTGEARQQLKAMVDAYRCAQELSGRQ